MSGRTASRTDRGRVRANNEDAVLVADGGPWLLLAVADGLGGQRAGEVASAEAVRSLRQSVAEGHDGPPGLLVAAMEAANRAVCERAAGERRLSGMATTLVAAIADGATVWVANVGDSRAGVVTAGPVYRQVSEDHSLVGEYLREGSMSEEEARGSNLKHIVTRTVGSDPDVDIDLFGPITLGAGDTLVLSSDGLHDVVPPDTIARCAAIADIEGAAQALVDAANALGGPDNVSVVLYRAARD